MDRPFFYLSYLIDEYPILIPERNAIFCLRFFSFSNMSYCWTQQKRYRHRKFKNLAVGNSKSGLLYKLLMASYVGKGKFLLLYRITSKQLTFLFQHSNSTYSCSFRGVNNSCGTYFSNSRSYSLPRQF